MEPAKSDAPKLPDMVMCGDHPSITKTELNAKDAKPDDKDSEKSPIPCPRISSTSSRTERAVMEAERELRETRSRRLRAGSAHALRHMPPATPAARARALDLARPDADTGGGKRALMQAALGSFRWPPYLLAVWVCVLLLTHALHCLVGLLERALPTVRSFCQYFRAWTEVTWRAQREFNQRLYPIALALLTALLYVVYFSLYVVYSLAVWSIEPLCSEAEDQPSATEVTEPKVTNYMEEIGGNI